MREWSQRISSEWKEGGLGGRTVCVQPSPSTHSLHANAASYGFTKTFPGALDDSSLTDKSFTGPGQDYLYWDRQHATTKAHELFTVAHGPNVVFTDEAGQVSVVGCARSFALIAQTKLPDQTYATPVPMDDGLLVRAGASLYYLSAKNTSSTDVSRTVRWSRRIKDLTSEVSGVKGTA